MDGNEQEDQGQDVEWEPGMQMSLPGKAETAMDEPVRYWKEGFAKQGCYSAAAGSRARLELPQLGPSPALWGHFQQGVAHLPRGQEMAASVRGDSQQSFVACRIYYRIVHHQEGSCHSRDKTLLTSQVFFHLHFSDNRTPVSVNLKNLLCSIYRKTAKK